MKRYLGFIVLCLAATTLAVLFLLLYKSSVNYESNRVKYSAVFQGGERKLPEIGEVNLMPYQIGDPAQAELFVRLYLAGSLIGSEKHSKELKKVYEELLKIRPSWPYFYSGLSQIEKIEKNDFIPAVNKAIMLAPFERKVVLSVSQLLFSNWDSIDSIDKKGILKYLANQNSVVHGLIVASALRYARLFDFCDYLYEQKQLKNSVCLREFWQPLAGNI